MGAMEDDGESRDREALEQHLAVTEGLGLTGRGWRTRVFVDGAVVFDDQNGDT